MAEKSKKVLGRGLEAIFGGDVTSALEDIQKGHDVVPAEKLTIPLKEIRVNPYQPRITFDEDKLKELSSSIEEHGVFTPILVKKAIKGYELIAGERRVRAARMAGLIDIPAMIVDFTDEQMMEIALLENIQRENLSVIEEAKGYASLIERLQYTQEQLAKRVGKSREHIANTMRLLRLPEAVQQMVIDGKLSMGHVRALLSLEPEQILMLAQKIIKDGLSVRAVEKMVQDIHRAQEEVTEEKEASKQDYTYVEKLISDRLQTRVSVTNKQIVIKFHDDEELNRLLELMQMLED